jgi:vacuolar-type H+-ATPase subunit I/STV1
MAKPRSVHSVINEIVDRINDNTKRLRTLEQRSQILASRMNSVEKEMLRLNKNTQKLVSGIETRIKEQDNKVFQNETTVKEIIKQIKKLATGAKISELEELLEIYNPLKSQFVTREEVERMINEKTINR